MNKTARYSDLVETFEQFLGTSGSTKTAETQGSDESSAPEPGSNPDPEIKDMVPGDGKGGDSPTNPVIDKAYPTGEGPEGTPPEEKPHKEETSPNTKVASDESTNSFMSLIGELRSGQKTAESAPTPEDAKSDPEIAEMLPGSKQEEVAPESDSEKPEAEVGAGSSKSAGFEIDENDLEALTSKVASFLTDQSYAHQAASNVIDRFFVDDDSMERKVAAAVESTPAEAVEVLEAHVNAKVAELAADGHSSEQILSFMQKAGMDEAEAMALEAEAMEGGGAPMPEEMAAAPEEMMGGEEGGAEVIVAALQELVAEGEITEEEAVQAAEVIDEAMAGEGASVEDIAAEPEVEAAPEGGTEEGDTSTPSPEKSGEDEEGGEQKEASLRFTAEMARGQKIASLIRGRVQTKLSTQKEASAKTNDLDVLMNQKVATLRGLNASDDSIREFFSAVEDIKSSGNAKIASDGEISIQDAMISVDRLVEGDFVTPKQAALALENYTNGDSGQLESIVMTARSLENVKTAMAPPMDPAAAGGAPPADGAMAPPADPAAAGGAPPADGAMAPPADPAAAGGAPPAGGGGDPSAAVEQLLGSLEQLVASGVVTEDQAIGVVQQLGIIPAGGPEGGAPPAGGPPMDPAAAGGAPPAPAPAPAPGM